MNWRPVEAVVDVDKSASWRFLLPLALLPWLASCAMFSPHVDSATRASIDANVHPGMTLGSARAALESTGYRCRKRSGSYFDENGEEHVIDGTFASCEKVPDGGFRFACAQRPHVVLVPNGNRVARVVVDTAPACTDTRPSVSRRPHYP